MTIVDEIRQNRENGAKRLEEEYKAGLMTLARRFCVDESDAEELVNRTLAAVVDGIDKYIEQSAFFGWMCQILSNIHSLDNRRKFNKDVIYPGTVPDVVDEDAREAIYRDVDAVLLRDAVDRLPKEARELLTMHYFMDMPVAQIAKILTMPDGTVRSKLYYARKLLAAKLGAFVKKPRAKALLLALALAALAAVGAVGVAAIRSVSEPAAEEAEVVFNAKNTENTEEPLEVFEGLSEEGLSLGSAPTNHETQGDSPQVVAEVTDNFNTNNEENAMNGSIVKKSAAKLVAAAAILSAGTALSGSASIVPVPGYDILEYLESSGTQYIDTGVVYANDTKLTQRFCVVDFAGVQMQMGALDRIANVWHRIHWGVAGESTLRYIKWIGLGNAGQTTLPAGANGWVDVSIDASDQSYTEDGHSTIAIFARNESGTFTCGKFRVGITRIWKGTDLVRLLVPARRLSDNALGLYDYCEPKFYENGGSGEFAAGPAMKYLVVAKAIPDSLQSIDSPVEAYCPLPVVKEVFTGRTLTKDVDYTVAWTNNTRFGEGTCTVSGAGDYATATPGSATFLIVPQAKLPHEFQRLLYLETTGTVHYVDTDIHPTANTRITAVAQTTANANTYLVGILDTPQWRRFHLGAKWMINQKFYLAGGVGGNETQYTADDRLLLDDGWNKLTMDAANKVLSVNDGTTYALVTSGTLPTESTLRIFGRASNSESHNVGNPVRIADVAIYESGEKTHEYIPCRRESDGVLGLYDVVDKLFLVNSGSAEGGFLAGPELKDDTRVSGFLYIVR